MARRENDSDNRLLYDSNDRINRNRELNHLGSFSDEEDNVDEESNIDEEVKSEEEPEDNQTETNNDELNNDANEENEEENEDSDEGLVSEVTNIAKEELKSKIKEKIILFIKKYPWILLIVIGVLLLIIIIISVLIDLDDADSSGNYLGNSTLSSACGSTKGSIVDYIDGWEGETAICSIDGLNGYMATDIGDGAVTSGYGVTNSAVGRCFSSIKDEYKQYFCANSSDCLMVVGQCYPQEAILAIRLAYIKLDQEKILYIANNLGLELYQYQLDAVASFTYNTGIGTAEAFLNAYATGGYEGLWAFMKDYYKDGYGNEYRALKLRRKSEFNLFVTGDYTDEGGLFYTRTLVGDYDDYNSDGVMEMASKCESSGEGYIIPLDTSSSVSCTSPFGERSSGTHNGLDFGAPEGTNIYAAKDGEVTLTVNDYAINNVCDNSGNNCGNRVRIDHEDGSYTLYCHMLIGSVKVEAGDEVKQGDTIGEVGTSGCSTGNHLHFGIYINDEPVDPFDYLNLENMPGTCVNGG